MPGNTGKTSQLAAMLTTLPCLPTLTWFLRVGQQTAIGGAGGQWLGSCSSSSWDPRLAPACPACSSPSHTHPTFGHTSHMATPARCPHGLRITQLPATTAVTPVATAACGSPAGAVRSYTTCLPRTRAHAAYLRPCYLTPRIFVCGALPPPYAACPTAL